MDSFQYGISMEGKIALCRYGGLFRGDKVQLAAERGAIGLVLYSDPFDYTSGQGDRKVRGNFGHFQNSVDY